MIETLLSGPGRGFLDMCQSSKRLKRKHSLGLVWFSSHQRVPVRCETCGESDEAEGVHEVS